MIRGRNLQIPGVIEPLESSLERRVPIVGCLTGVVFIPVPVEHGAHGVVDHAPVAEFEVGEVISRLEIVTTVVSVVAQP